MCIEGALVNLFCAVGPVIVTHPMSVNVSLPESAVFTCVARGFPIPVITWTFNGDEVRL